VGWFWGVFSLLLKLGAINLALGSGGCREGLSAWRGRTPGWARRDGGGERLAAGPRAGAQQRALEPCQMGAVEFKRGEERVS